jgi:hypothetical protein
MSAPDEKSKYLQQRCGVCKISQAFKVLNKRDEYERTLMVCTRCGSHTPVPGQQKQVR